MATTLLCAVSNTVDAGGPAVPMIERNITGSATKAGSVVQTDSVSSLLVDPAVGDPTDWDAANNLIHTVGVVKERKDYDVDTVIPAGKSVQIYPLGSGKEVYIEVIESAGDILEGAPVYVGTTAGKLQLMTIGTAGTPTADEALAHGLLFVGRVQQFSADSANTRWIKVKLSK